MGYSPILAVGPQLYIEGPGTPILPRQVPRFLCDSGRLDEEVIRLVLVTLARPGDVDDRVNTNVRDVNALRAKFPRHGFGQNALRSLGRSKAGERWSTPEGGRMSGHDDGAAPRAYHRWRETPRQVEQPHRVDLKIAVEHCWVDFQECAEGNADCVVHQDARHAEVAFDFVGSRLDLSRIRYIAYEGFAIRELAL